MPSPNVKFVATEKTDNNKNGWKTDLEGYLSSAKNQWSSDLSGWEEDSLYGSVIKDDLVSLDNQCRNDIESGDFACLENAAESTVDTSNTDSVIVFDDYDYSGFDGRAQIGDNHESSSIRVGVCGKGGFNNKIALHETLHTFNARHRNHRGTGWIDRTVMGASSGTGCNNGRNSGIAKMKINNSSDQCHDHSTTATVVATWTYHEL